MSFKSFAVTHRPKNGISDEDIESFCVWVRKHCDYYYVGVEKEDTSRHIHAGLFLKREKPRGDIVKMLQNLWGLQGVEKYVMSKGIKVQYDGNFIENYIGNPDKDGDYHEIMSNLPEARHLEGYYPKKNTELQSKKRKRHLINAEYHRWEELWYEQNDPGVEKTFVNVRKFLCTNIHKTRKIDKMRDRRTITFKVMDFTHFLNKATDFEYDDNFFV